MEAFYSVTQGFPDMGGGRWEEVPGRTVRPYGPPSAPILSPHVCLTGSLQQVQGIVLWARGHRTGSPQNGNDLQEERPQRSDVRCPKMQPAHWHQIDIPQMPGGAVGQMNRCVPHGGWEDNLRELVTLSVSDTNWRVWTKRHPRMKSVAVGPSSTIFYDITHTIKFTHLKCTAWWF